MADFPRLQELRHVAAEDRARVLDEMLRDLREYLEALPRFERRSLVVEGGEVARLGLDYVPRGVLVEDVRQYDDNDTSASVESPDWTYERSAATGRGELVIRDIEGLTAGTQYRVSLLVVR